MSKVAKIDPEVRQKILDLEAKLLTLKGNKIAYENTKALLQALKRKHGIKE